MATPVESANLILKLYELRREPVMREARNYFMSFDPRSPNRNPHRQPYGTMVKGEYWEDAADNLEAAE